MASRRDDKVGHVLRRNRIEIVIRMLGIVKASAILVNVNFRYVEGRLIPVRENSDMVALIHERQYADRVANVLPKPEVKTVLVGEGSDQGLRQLRRRRVPRPHSQRGKTIARLRSAQPGRHLPPLHRRDHRLPQGRDVAS